MHTRILMSQELIHVTSLSSFLMVSFCYLKSYDMLTHSCTAEKAYAIAQNSNFGPNGFLTLSLNGKPELETRPSSRPYLIKQLPDNISPGYLYDLFRRFGPLFSVRLQYDPAGNFG